MHPQCVCGWSPALLGGLERRRIAALRRLEQIGGEQDVLLEQRGDLLARFVAIEGRDDGADIGLVAE
jgi:hypothetical protein